MPDKKTLGKQRFYRSVRLELDLQDPTALNGYSITPQVLQVLHRVEEGLRPGSGERAITLTGPYGTGKSAFAVFLASLFGRFSPAADAAWAMLSEYDSQLASRLRDSLGGLGLLPITLTARRFGLRVCLTEAMLRAAKNLPSSEASSITGTLERDLNSSSADSRNVVNRVAELCAAAVKTGVYGGLLVLLDELGKTLEYSARHAEDDIFLLQELAELASRSSDQPMLLVGILHQAFEQYAEYLDTSSRREWSKVQGRFSDIAFLEPPEQQMRLAARAVASPEQPNWECDRGLLLVADALVKIGAAPPGLNPGELRELSARAFPLHPTVLITLPHLFRRFGQNERSLYAYLLSCEPFSMQDLLRRRGPVPIRLADLFDYFSANFSSTLHHYPSSRRWFEALTTLERAQDLSSTELQVLKSIAVLTVLGEVPYLRASENFIALAVSDQTSCPDVAVALARLREHSFTVLRRFNKSYRIWEGSDIDIEALLEEGKRRTSGLLPVVQSLSKHLPRQPLAARRHSHEMGALRFMEVTYIDVDSLGGELPSPEQADGLVLCCLPGSAAEADAFRDFAASPQVAGRADVLIAVPQEVWGMKEATAELHALHWAWENTPELQSDRVARRELAEHTAAVERELERRLGRLLDHRPEPYGCHCTWFYRGHQRSVSTPRDVAGLLSDVMDTVYPLSPRIRNELINRRKLSSAAAAGRRTLVERMLSRAEYPSLEMTGYPPERSMYESVLLRTGIHRKESSGKWSFGPPPPDDPVGLRPVWQAMENMVFDSPSQPCQLEQLQAALKAPPFGVMAGVIPMLVCAFMLAYADEATLYREGTFLPEPGIADYEVMMRRPELFAIGGSRVKGIRVLVVERMACGLGVRPATVPVVRGLFRMVSSLPEHSWRTQRLSPRVKAVREAFERARSPEQLLFHDLPLVLGESPLDGQEILEPGRVERLFEELNSSLMEWSRVTPLAIVAARDRFLCACGLPVGESGWTTLRALARSLVGKPLDSALLTFVDRLTAGHDDATVLEGVLALVSGRPPRKWTDRDEDNFVSQAAIMAEQFNQAAEIHGGLTPDEGDWSQKLTAHLREQLPHDVPPRVVRAALRRLLEESQ